MNRLRFVAFLTWCAPLVAFLQICCIGVVAHAGNSGGAMSIAFSMAVMCTCITYVVTLRRVVERFRKQMELPEL